MGPAPPTFSVVIAAFSDERRDVLRAAVSSVLAQTVAPHEVLVVIDHNPALAAALRKEAREGVVVLENAGAQGASGARNTGVEAATGDVIAFLDDDAAAVPHWLATLAPAFADPSLLGAGGRIVPAWQGGRPGWFPAEFDWVVGCTYRGLPDEPAEVRNLIAANMSMRRDAFLELGGFRHGFGKVGERSEPEETELCIRALVRWPERHWRYLPDAEVHHQVTPRRATWPYFVERCRNEGRGKASMGRYAPRGQALAAESAYVRRVLPAGVLAGLRDALLRREGAGAARAAAIVAGLAITAAGYLQGRVLLALGRPA